MKPKDMNETNTVFLTLADVDRVVGSDARKSLQAHFQKKKRGRRVLTGIIVGLGVALLIAGLIGVLAGCATRGTYNTLAATEQAVRLSYDGYIDSVIHGQTRTNDLPIVAKSFDAFQASFAVAVDKASGDTNAPVTGDLSAAAASLIKAITSAKGLR